MCSSDLDFELDVTPDAEVQLIFDSKIGDIIKGRGNGNLQMEVNTEGDFKMFGNFRAESGDYLFTLQNLINKKFIIQPGGTIKWTGDPYDAEVDIKGVYKLKASLYDLIKDTTLSDLQDRKRRSKAQGKEYKIGDINKYGIVKHGRDWFLDNKIGRAHV